MDWRALPKIYKEKMKKERTARLQLPSRPGQSLYGQGRRSQEAKTGRTILFDMAMKAEAAVHFMAMRYAINKIETREFLSRQQKQNNKHTIEEDYRCPVKLNKDREVIQTKEHIWGGLCALTNKEWGAMSNKINNHGKVGTKRHSKNSNTKQHQIRMARSRRRTQGGGLGEACQRNGTHRNLEKQNPARNNRDTG